MKRFDIPDAAERYLAGESIEDIAKSCGVSPGPVRRIITQAGVMRSVTEAQRLRFGSPEFQPEEVVRLYESGMSELAVSKSIGMSRDGVRRVLLAAGVKIRNRSEASYLRMSKLSKEERLVLAKAAHSSVRGVSHSEEQRAKVTLTRERLGSCTGEEEKRFAELLIARGIAVVPQKAIGRYNVDLGITESSIAVEIFGGHWHAAGDHAARHRKRIDYLLDRGWLPIIVWVTTNYPIADRAVDYVVTVHKTRRSRKPKRSEEHVIRGDGEGGPVSKGYPPGVPVVPCYKA